MPYARHIAKHVQCLHKPRHRGAREVDLGDVAGDNHLGAHAQAGEKHLYLMGGGVLCFVENYHGIVERAAAHKCQRSYLYHVAFHIFLELGGGNHILEGIVEWLQVRIYLVLHVAGQKTEFLAGFYRRTRQDDFAHFLILERAHCQGYRHIGFTRTCRPEGKGEVVFREGFHQYLLIGSASGYGLAVYAIYNGAVNLQFLGWRALYGVEYHILGEFVVFSAIFFEFFHLFLENRGLGVVAYHLDSASASRHTELGK